ncbi:helix-turn-helix transcriptional regulator [Lysobacter enzymogenes]|uniref:helix-turn-helix transcriptional regulator n=1 Tax=Lysobacter enzymogenes TaxID=69 RepID=UPI00099BD5EE|nr:helix-turn-helix transcriptional regulator [Lysobacter enzymogenes]UZW62201.1 helix-turn-helix domain-containing protein [Lysobacter enzymogenes]
MQIVTDGKAKPRAALLPANATTDMATRIRMARQRSGLTQHQLADRMQVTRGAVANWEISVRSKPSLSHLMRLAVVLEVSFEWLATGRGDMTLDLE